MDLISEIISENPDVTRVSHPTFRRKGRSQDRGGTSSEYSRESNSGNDGGNSSSDESSPGNEGETHHLMRVVQKMMREPHNLMRIQVRREKPQRISMS